MPQKRITATGISTTATYQPRRDRPVTISSTVVDGPKPALERRVTIELTPIEALELHAHLERYVLELIERGRMDGIGRLARLQERGLSLPESVLEALDLAGGAS